MGLGKGFTLFFFFFNRAERIRVPEPWITPPDLQEKIDIFAQKCLFLTESLKQFTGDVQQPASGGGGGGCALGICSLAGPFSSPIVGYKLIIFFFSP